MSKALGFFLLAVGAAVMQSGCAGGERVSGTISEDTYWNGRVLLEGDVYVQRGVTLTILPGTRIFYSKGEIKNQTQHLRRVEGRVYDVFSSDRVEIIASGDIVAKGTPQEPVVLRAPADMPERAGGFNFIGSKSTSSLTNVNIFGGYIGVRLYDSRAPEIKNIRIDSCIAGAIGGWDRSGVLVKDSFVKGNKYGIGASDAVQMRIEKTRIKNSGAAGVFFEGYSSGSVVGCDISGNDIGAAFGHESSARIESSTIAANGSGVGVWQEASPHIDNNYFRGNLNGSISADSSAGVFTNNMFIKNGGGITLTDDSAGRISENVFRENGPGIIVSGNSAPVINNNEFYANRYGIRNEGNSRADIYANTFRENHIALMLSAYSRPNYRGNFYEENTNDTVDSRL
ncbi:MAG: right-handed parallel beta-helix repeat-containing protein [Elusimicrobiota bacterium]